MKKTISMTLDLIVARRTSFSKRCWILLAAILTVGFNVQGQGFLEGYVTEGLRNNQVVQQKDIVLEKALVSLRIAEGMFMPSMSLKGS